MSYNILQIAPTIAEIFAIPLRSEAEPLREILRMTARISGVRVVLIVIDSFDCEIFKTFASEFVEIRALVSDGMIIACETVSTHTTPSIASILTGLSPESHGILAERDVGKSDIDSILEITEAHGFKTAAILEERGTEPLKSKISFAVPVRDREDIMSYDMEVRDRVISVLRRRDVMFVFAHLRAIDRFAHRALDMRSAARFTDAIIGDIVRVIAATAAKTLLLICGDHEAHLRPHINAPVSQTEQAKVPLIASLIRGASWRLGVRDEDRTPRSCKDINKIKKLKEKENGNKMKDNII